MAWIDASSVKLGCIGFSKAVSFRNSRYGSPLAKDVCKKANSKAHLIEIFNDNQSWFLMSEKVRKEVRTHIGIDPHSGPGPTYYWWIGAELMSGTWYWEHSKKPVTYWSRVGCDYYGTEMDYPYGCVNLSNFTNEEVACFCRGRYTGRGAGYDNYLLPICQI